MDKIVKRERLEKMPYDAVFVKENGNEELCHATGYVVWFNGDMREYIEYIDVDGEHHYA